MCISESRIKIKINLKGLHKTFLGTTKKYENKNLNFFLFVRDRDGKGQEIFLLAQKLKKLPV